MAQGYDRRRGDVGNVVKLEHVNLHIPDQSLATAFYVTGLGLTRDPYLMTGTDNMWVNAGAQQFHLQTGRPMVLPGRIGLVTPDLGALLRRLRAVSASLKGSRFSFADHGDYVDTVCPWGNQIRCHRPADVFGPVALGIPYVEINARPGSSDGIARFYRDILAAPADCVSDASGRAARICIGPHQDLIFRETERPLPDYDGHHLQIYVADFSQPHRKLSDRGLIIEESDEHQYRFRDIVDLATGDKLATLEHEVRSMRHPLFQRPLVNRNTEQSNVNYAPGQDAAVWSLRQTMMGS
jgi:hypothetical protein